VSFQASAGRESAKKIFHVFSTFDLGGPESRFLKLAALLGDEFEHYVVAMDGKFGAADYITSSNVQLIKAPMVRGGVIPNFSRLRALIKSVNPSHIVSYNFGALEAVFSSLALGIGHTHAEEGFGTDEIVTRIKRRNILRLLAFKVSRAKLVVVSQGLEDIARREWRVPAHRIARINNGVVAENQLTLDRVHLHRARLIEGKQEFWFGTAARLRPIKRIDRMLQAMAILLKNPSLKLAPRLLVLGDGPDLPILRDLAANLGITHAVEFRGQVEDVHQHMSGMHVFVMSSDSEQMPLGVIEAMHCQLPIISTHVGDIKDMVSHQNKPLIGDLTPESLAQSMLLLVVNPQNAFELGRQNREKALEQFSLDSMLEGWRSRFLNH
jgi:glycosyltransferase involved in cell wall biosynthesis